MRLIFLFIFISVLSACSPKQGESNAVEKLTPIKKINAPKNIVIVTYQSPITYYQNAENKPAGLEYDLAYLFTKKFGAKYRIKILVVNHINEVIPTLLAGKADIAAAAITVKNEHKQLLQFSIPYRTSQAQLAFNHELNKNIKNIEDITQKKIIIPDEPSYHDYLINYQANHPKLSWQVDEKSNAEYLLSQVAEGDVHYTIADSQLIGLLQNYYPNLDIALNIGKPAQVAWAFRPNTNPKLVANVNEFFTKIQTDGNLRNLIDRYFGHNDRLNVNDITYFLEKMKSVLPQYKRLFQEAEKLTGLDWRLIAAVSYRESHWDTNNTSPTNVRGIMMLTENTADHMGVKDRLDAKQSIPAGAEYILEMKAVFPKKIPEPDRTYFGLAAYNIGYTHVQDARALAKRLGLRQDSWADVKKTLMMLSNPEYYKTVKYGYASGGAPVVFVESVRSYQRILEKYQPDPEQDIHTLDLNKRFAIN